jgi:hypothetical protein
LRQDKDMEKKVKPLKGNTTNFVVMFIIIIILGCCVIIYFDKLANKILFQKTKTRIL